MSAAVPNPRVPARERFNRMVRGFFLGPHLHRLVPGDEALRRFVYLVRFSRWLKQNGCPKPTIRGRFTFYEQLCDTEGVGAEPIDYLEFGVREGGSFRWWVAGNAHPDTRFVGFDTFEGLPEAWGHLPKGTYSAGGQVPQIDDERCSFEVGLFQETLPGFMDRTPLDRRKLVHIDADLYSSTLFVLTSLARRLRPGDIVLFDEMGSLRFPHHEFRAFEDYVSAYGAGFRVLGATANYRQVAVRLEKSAIFGND